MTDSSSKAVLFELKFAVLLNLKETYTPLLGDVLRAFFFDCTCIHCFLKLVSPPGATEVVNYFKTTLPE